jgi:CHAT domain-containing protein
VWDEALSAGPSLANSEVLSAREVLDLEGFRPRLVVASACETGVIQGYETADEALALGTVFVAAGAAGVIATLWAVDDYATALLMSRFYEILAEDRLAPAEALRSAQLWLRELTPRLEEDYLLSRSALRKHRSERLARTTRAEMPRTPDRPYGASSIWAAFTFSGA